MHSHTSIASFKPTGENQLSVEERSILYHLGTKVLAEDFRVVHTMIKKSIVKMFKGSSIFKGNVRRLQAYALVLELYKAHGCSG